MDTKLRTKILVIFICIVFSIVLSAIGSWLLIQSFTGQTAEILNISISKVFTIFSMEEGIQLFIILLLCFMVLIATSVFKIFNLDDYLSKTYQVTKEIRIPLPVGKNQTQQGSSWWLSKKDFNRVFGINTFDSSNPTIAHLLNFAEKERKREGHLMEHQEEIIPGKTEITETVDPIFKKGGLVVGKIDRNIYKPHIKKIKGIFPYVSISKRKVEDICYIKDDMHSLTVGATRSGKTRCLVLQSIENTALAGENIIASDPKGELYEYTSGSLKQLGYNVLTLDFKTPLKSSKYNFLQPVIEQVQKGDIPKALNYCSDIAESLVGEVGNREAIWVNGEKSVIKTGIMAVVMGNNEDKITDEKIRILYKDEFKEERRSNVDTGDELYEYELEQEEKENQTKLKKLTNEYRTLSQKDKDELREKFFIELLDNVYNYINNYGQNTYYFTKFYKEPEEESIKKEIREELYYNLDEFLKEFNNLEVDDLDKKVDLSKILAEWKVLNELRPHPEFMNLPNVYNFISKMCAEQEDKTMLMDTYIEGLPTSSPVVQQFAPAQIAPSKTRASFFTSALATLNIFVDDYVASMINENEIDINKFNEEKTALFMILPDEKTTFYGLCSLFVNQCYTKLCELADARGGRLKIRHNFILDEFGNFSAIPNFGGFLTVGGGRGIRFNLFIQSFSQLNDKYGDNTAKNILDNCHVWTYLKTSNFETADMITKKLGTYTCTTWSASNSSSGGPVNKSNSMNLSQRSLLTADEVLRIQRPALLVMVAGENPAVTNSPDLHLWYFNKTLGLGDPAWNTKIRDIREKARFVRKITPQRFWEIDKQIKQEKEKEKEQQKIKARRNFGTGVFQ